MEVFNMVWKEGMDPSDWRNTVIVYTSLQEG